MDASAVVNRACTATAERNDPRFNTLQQVVNDGSNGMLMDRRALDEATDLLPIEVATAGGTTLDMYGDLDRLLSRDSQADLFRTVTRADPSGLPGPNRDQIVAETTRLRGVLAQRAAAEVVAEIEREPLSEVGFDAVGRDVARFLSGYTADAAPVQRAAAEKRRAIVATLAAAVVQRMAASPTTLEAFTANRAAVASLKDKASDALADRSAALEVALTAHGTAAAKAASEAEVASIAAADHTKTALAAAARGVARLERDAGGLLPHGGAPLRDALAALRNKVQQAMAEQAIADLQARPYTLEELKRQAAAPEEGPELDVARTRWITAAVAAVLTEEKAALAAIPADGVDRLATRLGDVEAVIGSIDADGAKSYAEAADARLS